MFEKILNIITNKRNIKKEKENYNKIPWFSYPIGKDQNTW